MRPAIEEQVKRILALRDVDVVAVPTAWVAGFDAAVPEGPRIGQVDGALVQANLNSVFVACADQVGAAAPFTFLQLATMTAGLAREPDDPGRFSTAPVALLAGKRIASVTMPAADNLHVFAVADNGSRSTG